jgi:transcriptional regulator with XRE-family HTH domain
MKNSPDVAHHFGANLRRVRKQANLSQEEVGFRSSLHRTEVGLLERGARVPRIDTLVKLASALGVRFECPLLGGIEWTPGGMTATPGAFTFKSREEMHAELLERAAALRASQSKPADAVALVREGREDLEKRGVRQRGDEP